MPDWTEMVRLAEKIGLAEAEAEIEFWRKLRAFKDSQQIEVEVRTDADSD